MPEVTADRLIDADEVDRLHPVSRVTRWRMVRDQKFPKPVRSSPGRIAWREREAMAWIASR